MDTVTAQKTWELTNKVENVASYDDIYKYDKKQQQDILAAKPWEREWVVYVYTIISQQCKQVQWEEYKYWFTS